MHMIIRKMASFVIAVGVSNVCLAETQPIDVLQQQAPALYKLYVENSSYAVQLGEYASRQGFRQRYENLGTVVHEMVHVASAVHDGFYIEGVYYEPYVHREAWPALTNSDVGKYMVAEERGVISSVYMPNTPKNNLGNVLDEINAYSHVAGFICRNEPSSADKQIRNLVGHLQVQEAYLRVARTMLPTEYMKMAAARESRGAIETLYGRAVDALRACGVPEAGIPGREARYFLALGRKGK